MLFITEFRPQTSFQLHAIRLVSRSGKHRILPAYCFGGELTLCNFCWRVILLTFCFFSNINSALFLTLRIWFLYNNSQFILFCLTLGRHGDRTARESASLRFCFPFNVGADQLGHFLIRDTLSYEWLILWDVCINKVFLWTQMTFL